ncbi:uncharacterized protein LOC129745323 [Uranotaenia lowii]|uniref:uncharacterized protein LOC129745323 n=1 Tax=Uranotaenia lowii TaxID=190385 RepID=UPI002478F530|nr:uncharacterized protein LOC129745323 [Uranotaenia lowii]
MIPTLRTALLLCAIFGGTLAHYGGPFLLWGVNDLKDVEVSALEGMDDKFLRDLYSNSAAVVLFLRNGTTRLSDDTFPGFRRILEKHEFAYSPQHELLSNPLDYNVNAEIINLVGSPAQQDVELSALYRDSVANYGERKVLGILANRWDDSYTHAYYHGLHKREAKDDATSTTPAGPTDEPEIDDALYNVPGKALIYVTSAPVLTINSTDDEYVLSKHTVATYDARERESKMIVIFKVEDTNKLTLRFRFEMDSGYWSMPKVDVFLIDTKSKDGKTIDTTLEIDRDVPYAPIGSSYSCSKQLVFRNGSTVLTLENIQVQPAMEGSTQFGSAWDCIGFTTAAIWSGIFVTSIMGIGLSLAICAILDIKPPNRFESRTGKQLSFTVQE